MLILRKRLGKSRVEIDNDCNHSFAERVYFIDLGHGVGQTKRHKNGARQEGFEDVSDHQKSEG